MDKETIVYPDIIFRLNNRYYTIGSRLVASIMEQPHFEAVPGMPGYVRGMFLYGGASAPLVDLRMVLGMPSLEQDYREFVDMLEMRKQDHLQWADELERCIHTGDPFTLATDPHKCAFGRWYDAYKPQNETVRYHLSKIDEPHQKLHQAALEVQQCKQECGVCTRDECLKKIFERVRQDYVPCIVGLLDEAKEVFRTSYRSMVLMLVDGARQLGLMVDEVLAVEMLTELDEEHQFRETYATGYVTEIKKSARFDEPILHVDEERLVSLLKGAEEQAAV